MVVNVLWAIRWFLSPRFVSLQIYGVNETMVDALTQCGLGQCTGPSTQALRDVTMTCTQASSGVFWHRTCVTPLASFLAYPWALMLHASGAIVALALGPFQLWTEFRQASLFRHKVPPA